MHEEQNQNSLDTYALGWSRGDSSIILSVVEDSYAFSGLPKMDPVDKINFKLFWVNFRLTIQDAGGPGIASSHFMEFKNIIRRRVG